MPVLLVYIFLLIMVLLVFGTAAYAGLQAAPWVPSFRNDFKRIVSLADIKENELVYDLGSGDGRILVAVANNTKARLIVGYELSFIPYLWSKFRLIFLGMGRRVEVRYANFLNRDLSQANVIFCFLTPMAMKKLKTKFEKELKKGTRVVSYSFKVPDWQPQQISKPRLRSIPIFKYII